MIPPYVIPIKFLPLTLSGKLDRKLLRHIGSSLPIGELPSLTVAPESRQEDSQDGELGQMQTRIAELWLKVLPLHPHRVNPSDNFFKLGGDSIHAMQLVGVANLANIRLTTSKIFQHPTLTGMSLAALEATTMNSPPKRFPSDCVSKTKQLVAMMEEMHCPGLKMSEPEIEDIIEAPDLQAYMVVCGLLKSHGYINYFTFDLAGPIDSSRLADSCRMLVARHSIFRTVFALHAGRIHQVIRKKHDPEIAQCSSKEETGALLTDLCYLERSCDTQLGDDIVRFLLVERGLDKYTLIMRLSHAQFDGTSLALIYRDLQVLYAGEAMPPAPQFKEWAWASKEANSSKAEDYWRELLQGSTMTSILDHSSTAYRNVINSRLSLTIPFTSVQEKGITVATLVKAAWAVVLAELSSTTDVVFGNAVTGRNLQINAVNQIVGDCNNAVLVRARLENATTVLSLFKQIQDQLVAAIPYETIGCRQLVERCTDWPPWTRYSTSVNHQNYTDARLDMFTLGKTQCSVSYKDLESDRRDIQIYSYPPTDDGMMKLEMAFSDCALAKDMVERMLQRLGETVQRLSRNVDAPLVLLSNPIPSTLPLKIAVKGSTSMKEELRPDPRPCTFGFSLLNPRIIVEKVWRKFEHLFEGSDMARTGRLDDNTPFYELGGDLVYAVQLSAWYQQEGITFPMEELIENPTKMSQVDLLSRFASSRKGQALYRMLLPFYNQVCTPPEAPEKPDHGDIDILVDKKRYNFTRQDLAQALGAVDHLQVGPVSSFAIPVPESNTEFFQLDVHTCKPGFFEWETMIYTHGDLWLILGISANRLGFTINDTGLHIRIAGIEALHPKDCLLRLTSEPKEMMEFLSLDADRFALGFTSLYDLFMWATSSPFFRRRYFEKKPTETRSRKAERPMYLEFRTKWLPQHPDVGVVEGDSQSHRAILTEEALRRFEKRDEYVKMLESHRERVMKDTMWRKIAKTLPLEGKELGIAMKALKALLRWRDGALELDTGSGTSDRVPALEEGIVDTVVVPWVLDHWKEAVDLCEKGKGS
ncbi:MAG: hypothetical protein LQ338_004437 [Usnochroma carphineum]|nr:MAG: hypothetical protein LQ338_004437 [Usnochroma carphineum]